MAAVIGDPVDHSLSPAIHNAAFAAAGLDWVFVALPVAPGDAAGAVAGMRAFGLGGLSVTMPHKVAIMGSLDRLTDTAQRLAAVNCVFRSPDDDAVLVGDNTDGAGFLAALAVDFGLDPAGRRCVVLGAGGAARAVVLALGRAGAASVQVVNRRDAPARDAAALAGAVGSVADPEAVRDADLLVNATPVGMGGDRAVPVRADLLGAGQVVAELIYHPRSTPLMEAARAAGARTANGTSMLVHQAAVAFERWTGRPPPLAEMRAAVGAV